jgi:hypothetical protein
MMLYLPAIFSPDVGLFGSNWWYNHDEWDFQSLWDGIHDALLKFYIVVVQERLEAAECKKIDLYANY